MLQGPTDSELHLTWVSMVASQRKWDFSRILRLNWIGIHREEREGHYAPCNSLCKSTEVEKSTVKCGALDEKQSIISYIDISPLSMFYFHKWQWVFSRVCV